ncbi:acyltransferase-domain-containing protein [Aulographum hederae CBS 113979]|uniref:Acyltransferase-domain-containing protein n=1 Tax=Aulographum hederae CBS 113979 TaxID=1176131 RepID=A0A6G1HAH1_9PEZI|nr:acyltransferase-domain-containing protein [Aulographum hederae CBS 113979]
MASNFEDRKKKDFGSGLRLSADNVENHPAGPPKHQGLSQAERAFSVASTFLSGILAINGSQWIGAPLRYINPEYYDAYMSFTKQSFAVLITSMTQWWAPTVVRVSGDASMKGQLQQMPDGSLKCNFPNRLTMMANHQLYTDWLYLWWIAYTNGMHGRIHIILKESLKNIPFLGWGAQFYNFIFVARKWEQDKARFQQHLKKLNNSTYPMWLLIFPEGTNLAKGTREASRKWAEKNGLQDMKHQLLPRSTGLRFCLEQLRDTTPWLYDCTIAYEGVPPGEFGQDIFTLRSSFLEGRPPKSVNMHWRRFHVNDIPIDDDKAFEVWLRNRWREKDYLLEYFVRHNRFPADQDWMIKGAQGKTKEAPFIETQVKSSSWEEFLMIFAPVTAFVMVLFLFYGASSGSLLKQMEQVSAQATQATQDGGNPFGQGHRPRRGSDSSMASSAAASSASAPLAGPVRRGSGGQLVTANGLPIRRFPTMSDIKKMSGKMPEPKPITVQTADGRSIQVTPTQTSEGMKLRAEEEKPKEKIVMVNGVAVRVKDTSTKSAVSAPAKATATAAATSVTAAKPKPATATVNGTTSKVAAKAPRKESGHAPIGSIKKVPPPSTKAKQAAGSQINGTSPSNPQAVKNIKPNPPKPAPKKLAPSSATSSVAGGPRKLQPGSPSKAKQHPVKTPTSTPMAKKGVPVKKAGPVTAANSPAKKNPVANTSTGPPKLSPPS